MSTAFRCERDAFAASMQLLDRYLASAPLHSRAHLQLLGAVALFVAVKATGSENKVISIDSLSELLCGLYNTETIKVQSFS